MLNTSKMEFGGKDVLDPDWGVFYCDAEESIPTNVSEA